MNVRHFKALLGHFSIEEKFCLFEVRLRFIVYLLSNQKSKRVILLLSVFVKKNYGLNLPECPEAVVQVFNLIA